MGRWKFFVAVTALFLVWTTGCGETVEPEAVSGDPAAEEQPAAEGDQVQKETVFRVGQTIKLGDALYTVHGVREIEGNELFRPAAGNRWLGVEITVENQGSRPMVVSSLLGFSLQDGDSYIYSVTPLPVDTKGQLDGELGAGRKMRGEVTFEIPAEATGLRLLIDADVFGFGQAVVDLGL